MFCINCGNKIDDDAKFCPQCGASTGEKSDLSAPSVTLNPLSDISKIRILNIATTCCLILEFILVVMPWINISFVALGTYNGLKPIESFQLSAFSIIETITECEELGWLVILGFVALATIVLVFISMINNIWSYMKKKQDAYNYSKLADVNAQVVVFIIAALIVSVCLRGNCLTIGETSGWLNVSLSPTMYILLITDLALFVIRRIGEAYNEVNAAE